MMTEEEKQALEKELRTAVGQIDKLERKWLSLTEDERKNMPAPFREFFGQLKQ